MIYFEGEHGNEEEHDELQCGGNTIGQKISDAHKYSSRDKNAVHNRGEAGLGQHNVCCCSGCVRRPMHGHSNICSLERGRVVHTVAGHASLVAELSQALHDQIFVLWIHLRETVRGQAHVSIVPRKSFGLLLGGRVQQG